MLSFSNFAEAWPESMNPRAADTGIDGYIKRCSSEGELYDAFTQVLRQIDGSAVDVQLLFPAVRCIVIDSMHSVLQIHFQ